MTCATTTVAAPASVPARTARPRVVLVALAAAGLAVSVQQTLVIPLIPRLMTGFGVSVAAVTWVFTASLLAGAVATPLLTRFGDLYGKKRMVLAALGLLLAGSVVCALSSSLPVLVAGRALQGTSAALVPLAIGMIRDAFPPARVTTAIGVVSATMGVGGTIGMIVTGVIADRTPSHRPVFWIAAGLAVAVLVLVAVATPDTGERPGGRPDLLGAALLAVWLVCLLLGISQGNRWGWTSAGVLGLFAAAAALCAVWTVAQRRTARPLVRLGLLVGPRSLGANTASALLGFSMFAAFTLIAGFVQAPRAQAGYGMSGSVLDVGLYMLPSTVTMLGCSLVTGRATARFGAAYTLAAGAATAAASYVWLAVANDRPLDVLAFSAIQGAGFGIAYAALGTLAVQHVPMGQSGIASGINSLVRTTGGSVAGAVTAAILTASTLDGTALPSRAAYELCFWVIAAGAALAALVAAAAGLRHRALPVP
ncbi:MFS transporter [Actinomadura flavalba]|uniref:MFS transporter n=1 Tax=Actinomadura flavalba TaxID=1120938 RepID=UPI00036EF487|nr:MFS transporter [Actinomadura flavalba]